MLNKTIRKLKNNNQGIIGLVVALVIIVVIISTIVAIFIAQGGPFRKIGKIDYSYESTSNLNLKLDVINTVGSVSINYNDSIDSLMEARIIVWGRSQANISLAQDFNSSIVEGKVHITFDSSGSGWNFFNKTAMYYELIIQLNPNAIVEMNIETTTGSIDLNCITITSAVIKALNLDVTTGSIKVNLGENTIINCSSIGIESTTGSLDLDFSDIQILTNITFNLETSTGSIDMNYTQTILPANNYTANINAKCTTGSVNLVYSMNETEIGIRIIGTTTTGSVNIPGGSSFYESSGYASKNIKYIFNLETTTGSINAEKA